MLPPNEPVEYVKVPISLQQSPGGKEPGRAGQRRDFVSRARAIAVLRRVGCIAEPCFIDTDGTKVSDERVSALREDVEHAIGELASGRAAHARQTIEALDAPRKSAAEQVDDFLGAIYEAHARGDRSRDVLDRLLDTLERWLTPDGIARVDMLFDRIELDRAPESAGILLLATTRLTRAHFHRRDAFIERFQRWLVGRAGRTEDDVDTILQGLKE